MCPQHPFQAGGLALDEATLFSRAQDGCVRSLDQLMRQHDGLVQAVVRRQVLGDLAFAEALQAGRIGLWRAILRYDPGCGCTFATYAWPAIMRQVWRAVKDLRRVPDRLPWPGPASAGPSEPDAAALAGAISQALWQLVGGLPVRLRYVVAARYGLGDTPPALFREIGACLGVSGERARQLHQEALARLRHPAASQTLRSLLRRHTPQDYAAADALTQSWLRQRGGRRDR